MPTVMVNDYQSPGLRPTAKGISFKFLFFVKDPRAWLV
jgi:hypothetical protein